MSDSDSDFDEARKLALEEKILALRKKLYEKKRTSNRNSFGSAGEPSEVDFSSEDLSVLSEQSRSPSPYTAPSVPTVPSIADSQGSEFLVSNSNDTDNDTNDTTHTMKNDINDLINNNTNTSEVASSDVNEPQLPRNLEDLTIGRVLGEGSYAVVRESFSYGRIYALKILDKNQVISQGELNSVFREKTVLSKMNHPGIVKLHMTAMDDKSLYFLLEYCANGELFELIKKYDRLPQDVVRFYTAQILEALDHIHGQGIVHRDIKPENILLDSNLHIKITDFGTAKEVGSVVHTQLVRSSFVGTSHYLSPEILNEDKVSTSSDIWALGCVIYQMLVGRPPFSGATDYLIFEQIRKNQIVFPEFVSAPLRQLISSLLQIDPSQRPTAAQIREHPWFEGIDFATLWQQSAPKLPPIDEFLLQPSTPIPSSSSSPTSNRRELFSGFDQLPSPSRHAPSVPIQHSNSVPSPLSVSHSPKRGVSTSAPPQMHVEETPPMDTPPRNVNKIAQLMGREVLEPMAYRDSVDFHRLPPPMETCPWEQYLRDDELVVFRGIIEKRTGLIFRTREMFLTAGKEPRLFYLDPVSNALKGELDLKDINSIKVKKCNKKFQLITPWRIYNLCAVSGTASEWRSHVLLLTEHATRVSHHEASIKRESEAFDILLSSSPP